MASFIPTSFKGRLREVDGADLVVVYVDGSQVPSRSMETVDDITAEVSDAEESRTTATGTISVDGDLVSAAFDADVTIDLDGCAEQVGFWVALDGANDAARDLVAFCAGTPGPGTSNFAVETVEGRTFARVREPETANTFTVAGVAVVDGDVPAAELADALSLERAMPLVEAPLEVVETNTLGLAIGAGLSVVGGELVVEGGAGGLFADALVRSEGFDPEVGTFSELVLVGPFGDEGNRASTLPRSFAVGATVAVIDTGELWTITASGACTPGAEVSGGQIVTVGSPAAGGPWNMIGINGEFATDDGAAATALRWADATAAGRRTNNIVTTVVDGEGTTDAIEVDPDDAVFEGGAYDGLPIYRVAGYTPGDGGEVTLDGVSYTDPQTVIFLVNQATEELNGVWELFTDSGGDFGTAGDVYLVRTVVWNTTTDDDPTSPIYSPEGNVFVNTGGDHEGLWQTEGDGLVQNARPVKVAHLWANRWDETAAAAEPAGTLGHYLDNLSTGGGGLALGETSTTAYRGDRGKTAYDHSQVTSGNPHGTTAADIGAVPTSRTINGYDLTANRTLTAADVGAVPASSVVTKVLTATQSFTSTTTLAAITDGTRTLDFAIAANAVWTGYLDCYVTGSTSGDVQFDVTSPSGATVKGFVDGPIVSWGGTLAVTPQTLGTLPGPVSTGIGASTDGPIRLWFTVVNGANAGTVTFRAAQASSNGTPTVIGIGTTLHARIANT